MLEISFASTWSPSRQQEVSRKRVHVEGLLALDSVKEETKARDTHREGENVRETRRGRHSKRASTRSERSELVRAEKKTIWGLFA